MLSMFYKNLHVSNNANALRQVLQYISPKKPNKPNNKYKKKNNKKKEICL